MADSESIHDVPATPPSTTVSDRAPTGELGVGNRPEPQLKKRDRLLRGLQRMSSSPSLNRSGRSRSASSPYSLSGTLSCASLASTSSPFGQPSVSSYFSQPSGAASSSAQTSIPTSPIAERPGQEAREALESVLAARPVGCATPARPTISLPPNVRKKTTTFNLWADMPRELKIYVLSFLRPKELVRISRVSREFHQMCFDGQLWTCLDASEFYREIPAESLANIIVSAGPFVKDLNLRGCLQMEHYQRAEVMVKACRNLINATLEGCRNFKRSTLHSLLKANAKLAHLNLTGLPAVNNATCKIVANSCPQLETFNVSWCKHMDARGIKFVVEACPKLKDLRAGEIKGFHIPDVAEALFRTNNLERLVLAGCDDLTDTALQIMMHGSDPEIDYLTGRPMVPPRKLRHLDLTRCLRLTDAGVKALGYAVPNLEGLQLSGVTNLTDAALEPILASAPRLTHLELEDIAQLTNSLLTQHLAKSPCTARLQHLSVSYCENLSDVGMLPVIRACTRLRSVYMDNTRVSDLVLAEAAAMVRRRCPRPASKGALPTVSLSLVVYDCPNITWTGVREVLSRNTEAPCPPAAVVRDDQDGKGEEVLTSSAAVTSTHTLDPDSVVSGDGHHGRPAFAVPEKDRLLPAEVIGLKCFHGWQMTVDEHTKRVLRGDGPAARRLERKWADFMQANEEAGAGGAGGWRRRRRAREAQMAHDEEGGDGLLRPESLTSGRLSMAGEVPSDQEAPQLHAFIA
ncbi:RNI-like protein [Thermothelomyces heterothallicus CBS 203.75]